MPIQEQIILQVDVAFNNSRLADLQKELQANKEQVRQLGAEYKSGAISADFLRAAEVRLQQEARNLHTEQNALSKANEAQIKATQAEAGSLEQLQLQLRASKAAYSALTSEEKANVANGGLLLGQQRILGAAIEATKKEKLDAARATELERKANEAAAGSIDALKLKSAQLTAQYNAMSQENRENTTAGKALAEELQNVNAALLEGGARVGDFRRQVGNYAAAGKVVGAYVQELVKLQVQEKSLATGSKDLAENQQRQIGFQSAAQQALAKSGQSYEQAQQTISNYAKSITPAVENLVRLSAEQARFVESGQGASESARKIGFEIASTTQQLEQLPIALDKGGNSFVSFFKKAAGFAGIQIGVTEIVNTIKQIGSQSIDSAKEGSDSIADMEKSLNATTEQATALREQLEGIDTRTSQENLEKIAIAGGQMNVAIEDVDEFTEAVDQAAVALKDEFPGGVTEVTKSIGGLQKLFKETQDLKADEAITKIGSSLNALGADGQATSPVIAEFTARIGQLSDLAPEITQTMGLGAAFQELGLSAEISSGGVTNVLLTASTETEKFARQLGITEEQFKKLLNSDPNEVLLQLAESFKGASSTDIIQTLDDMGIKSQEATKVVSLLASKTDFVREKQALANEEFRKGTSLYEEYLKKNTNAASQVDKAEKTFARFRRELGEYLIPVYIRALELTGLLIGAFTALPRFVRDNQELFYALGVALITLNLANIKATASTLAHIAVEKGRALAVRATTAAMWLLDAAAAANPLGIMVAAAAILVGLLVNLYNNSEQFRESIAGLTNVARRVFTEFKTIALDTLGGVGNLFAGIFTANPAQIAKGLASLKGVGTKAAEAYHAGYKAQEEKEQDGAKKRADRLAALEIAAAKKRAEEKAAAEQEARDKAAAEAAAEAKVDLLEQLKLQQAGLEQRLAKAAEGSEQELKLKKQLVLVARDIELQAEKKTAGDRAVIRGKAQLELDKLNREFAEKTRAAQLQQQQEEIELALRGVRQGSDQELALRQRLLDNVRDKELTASNLTAAQKRLIDAKHQQGLLELTTDFAKRRVTSELQLEANAISARLLAVRAGGEDERRLQQQLIEKQREQALAGIDTRLSDEQQASQKRLINAKADQQQQELRYQEASKAAAGYLEENQNTLEKARAKGKLTEKEYERGVYLQALASIEARISLAEQFNKDTTELVKERTNLEINELKRLGDAERSINEARGQAAADFGRGLGILFAETLSDTGATAEEFFSKLLILIIDSLEKEVLAAQTIAVINAFKAGPIIGIVEAVAILAATTAVFEGAKAILSQPSAKQFAQGGEVKGPGGPTEDKVIAYGPGDKGIPTYRLSAGEHVLAKNEVDGLGGHAAVQRLRQAARTPGQEPIIDINGLWKPSQTHFATGGPVGFTTTQSFDGGFAQRAISEGSAPSLDIELLVTTLVKYMPKEIGMSNFKKKESQWDGVRAKTTLGGKR